MPVDLIVEGQSLRLYPVASEWKSTEVEFKSFEVDDDFYVTVKNVTKQKK
jgi:hypothetical protein